MKVAIFYSLLILVTAFSPSVNADQIDDKVADLENYIGAFPPNFSSEDEKRRIVSSYEKVKGELDVALLKSPDSQDALFRRGILQSMGHNMDYPGAWEGADADLRRLLALNPRHLDGLLTLASMYVNTGFEYAPAAEEMFIAAQCLSNPKPNEDAQRGLHFAYHYQGNIKSAYRQLQILRKYWPKEKFYEQMEKGYKDRFAKELLGQTRIADDKIVPTTCRG